MDSVWFLITFCSLNLSAQLEITVKKNNYEQISGISTEYK